MFQNRFDALQDLHLDGTIDSLLHVYRIDPELFFSLATERIDASGGQTLRQMSTLAHELRDIVARGYEIVSTGTEVELRGAGRTIRFDSSSAEAARTLLTAINGVRRGACGTDYRGRVVSDAEILFALGDRSSWSEDELNLKRFMAESPSVLRVFS